VQAIHHHHHHSFEILRGIVLYGIYFTSHQYIAMPHTSIGIGIARGQYYWILDALTGIVLTLLLTSSNTCGAGVVV